jgi:DNA-binding beta-propeller fold protein YncE
MYPAIAILLAVLLLSPGCDRGGRPPAAGGEGAPELTWPAPPARARIRHVRTVAGPADLGIRRSFWEWVGEVVAGRDPEAFVRPAGLAARDGVLYVTDPGGPALWILDTAAGRSRRIGEAGGHRLVSPVAVALAPGGQVFLADSALARVFRLDGAGRTVATVTDPRLRRPAGLAYDGPRDRLYVADSAAHRVFVLAGDGRPAGELGRRGGGPGEFNFPTHLAVAPDGALLVTDALGYRIQRFAPDGTPAGHFGRQGDAAGDFASPKGVALDSEGHVYVVEALFDAVQIFDERGRYLLGFGGRGTGRGQLWLPGGLFIDPQDRIYVGDAYNRRVQVFEYLRGAGDDGEG